MKTYYYQIKQDGKEWDQIPAFPGDYPTREKAIEMAKSTAKTFNQEVRLTDNAKLLQGSYFRP